MSWDPMYDFLYCKCPITEEKADLSLTRYVDDLVKILSSRPGDSLPELIIKSQQSLSELDSRLAPHGYGQNRNKLMALLALTGADRNRDLNAARKGKGSHMDHGCHPHRRREGALLVQMNASWRLSRLHMPHVSNNMDMSNAFASTLWPSLTAALPKIASKDDVPYFEQRFRWATAALPSSDGELLIKPTLGALMGDPFSVLSFGKAFGVPVSQGGFN